MKPGTKVKTPDGKGIVIEPMGKPIDKRKPILVRLNKPIYLEYTNFYYSLEELITL